MKSSDKIRLLCTTGIIEAKIFTPSFKNDKPGKCHHVKISIRKRSSDSTCFSRDFEKMFVPKYCTEKTHLDFKNIKNPYLEVWSTGPVGYLTQKIKLSQLKIITHYALYN